MKVDSLCSILRGRGFLRLWIHDLQNIHKVLSKVQKFNVYSYHIDKLISYCLIVSKAKGLYLTVCDNMFYKTNTH